MTLDELNRFFTREDKWIEEKILQVASGSKYSIIYLNKYDCLDLKTNLWEILSKPRNLKRMKTYDHIKGKINQITYLLLNKSGSEYIREKQNPLLKSKNFTNKIDEININMKELSESDTELSDYEKKLNKIDIIFERLIQDSDKEDRILFDLYYTRKINTVRSLSSHLKISNYHSYKLINYMNTLLFLMIKYDMNYLSAKKKINEEKMIVKKNKKLGILEIVEDNCKDCENPKCNECNETFKDCVCGEDIIEDIIEEDIIDNNDEDIIE